MTTKDKQDQTVTMDNKRKQITHTGFLGDLSSHKQLLKQTLLQFLPQFQFLLRRCNRIVEIGKEICDKTLLFDTRIDYHSGF